MKATLICFKQLLLAKSNPKLRQVKLCLVNLDY